MRSVLKRLIGEERLGYLAYFLRPAARRSWGGPFNGQAVRLDIVRAILDLRPAFVVESGTFRGTSTAFLAKEVSCPVITIERNERHFGFAKAQLRGLRNVEMIKGDSRAAILALAARRELIDRWPFFYLDAHWNEDLPLGEELELAFSNWPSAVAMVDDFKVPDDPGYGFDDYGPGKALTLEYTDVIKRRQGICAYFPSARSDTETGARRGCVVFAGDPVIRDKLDSLPQLRRHS